MKLSAIREILEAESAWETDPAEFGEREVTSCHASDLISDMLSFRGPDSLLLTGLTNAQVIRTAEAATTTDTRKSPAPRRVQFFRTSSTVLVSNRRDGGA